jgi:adenylate cyclase
VALAVLGETEQSRDRARRALLIDPQNMVMRYNLACALSAYLKDVDGCLELLEEFLPKADAFWVSHTRLDPDFDHVRGDARFSTLITAAELRLAEAGASA